mgnify:CR=1 FL=1
MQYFEFDLKQVKIQSQALTIITIKDITGILKAQQDIIDEMYQDAIECNYSHEQMTPLNCIIASSKIV